MVRAQPALPASRAAHVVMACCLAVAIASCSDPRPLTEPVTWQQPNVLLISLDALRADRLGSYGHTRPTSPFLDHLATRGVRFANAFTNTHGTPPSHATLFTSLYQESHRVSVGRTAGAAKNKGANKNGDQSGDRLPRKLDTLAEVLSRHGYRTLGVTDDGWMTSELGYDQGFDIFDDRYHGVDRGSRKVVQRVRQHQRGRHREQPLFVFFHTYEIHSPYTPPNAYADLFAAATGPFEPTSQELRKRSGQELTADEVDFLERRYDAGVRYTDDRLRWMFEQLEAIDFFGGDGSSGTLVIVTSDHGEELGDHGRLLHGASLYEELIHVPLIVAGSDLPGTPVRSDLVSLVDVAPTLYARLGIDLAPTLAGRDLFADTTLANPAKDVFVQYSDFLYALRGPRFKLIENRRNGRTQLFDLQRDPDERHDVSRRSPKGVEKLQRRLEAQRAQAIDLDLDTGKAEVSKETEEQLRALGYVG